MPCRDAMITNLVTAKAEQKVGEILDLFSEKGFHSIAVVSNDGLFEGLITMRVLFRQLLPTAALIEGGLDNLDFMIGAAPGAAKRLKKLREKTVSEIMDTRCETLEPHTNSWEAVRVMVQHGSPVPVVEESTRKFVGMISSHTILENLQDIIDELEGQDD